MSHSQHSFICIAYILNINSKYALMKLNTIRLCQLNMNSLFETFAIFTLQDRSLLPCLYKYKTHHGSFHYV